jgi:hypothetical protein
MDSPLVVVLLILLVVVAGIAFWLYRQKRQTEELRDRFGPEYEHAVRSEGDRARAESDLRARERRVDELDIRPLADDERDEFAERWRSTQARFVDDPAGATKEADGLVMEVMQARGYPMGDFDRRAADVSVNHPGVVDHYRAAHSIALRIDDGSEDTEELRSALVHYRALFEDLLDTREFAPMEAKR